MHFFRATSLFAGAVALCSCSLGSGPRDNPPLVAITAPLDGATVGGLVSIDVAAADDSRVTKVRILVDGAQQGSDFTVAPYHVIWNTNSLPNGTVHTLRAEATDDAGNVGFASIIVTILNGPQSPAWQRVSRVP